MRILLFNQNWFKEQLRKAGHEVLSCGFAHGLDVQIEIPLLHIDTIFQQLPDNFQPDLIIWHDNSAPIMFTGLEESDIPLIMYSVDAHHHFQLHSEIGHIFDKIYVAQKDYIPYFTANNLSAEWLPLWASRYAETSEDKRWGATFVGTLNPNLNPERVKFFDELKTLVDIHLDRGEFWNIFPHAEIVVNQTVKGDLNFRVFEAMMCGAALLTEQSGNGLLDLFQDGKHLITYTKNNAQEAADRIKKLLSDTAGCRAIAKAGRDEILSKHTESHRAQVIIDALPTILRTSSTSRFTAAMVNYSVLSISLEKKNPGACTKALLAAMKTAEQALQAGEVPSEHQSYNIILSALRYDKFLKSTAGFSLLEQYCDRHPQIAALQYARIRNLLNKGNIQSASNIATQVLNQEPREAFSHAEALVGNLLSVVYDFVDLGLGS